MIQVADRKKKVVDTQHIQLSVPLSFAQVVDIVRQLSSSEKRQLTEVLWTEESMDDTAIPEKHQQIVLERIKKYENSQDSYLLWEDIENKMAARR
jgi:hypothetical protein